MDLSPDDDHFQGRLLHQAALWDNVELLQELLIGGADVNGCDASQRSAVHAAALAERSRCLVALCAAGADVDVASDERTGRKTALHISAERGHVENIRVLISSGAKLNIVDARGDTALALAERCGHRHAANALREARDALERERLYQHAALRELVTAGDVPGLTARLACLGAEAGLVVNLTPGGANTLLYVASESGQTGAVSALLDAGADGRAHPVTKYGPLYIAAYHGHKDIARLLLQHFPAAVQQETVEKWLPIHAACIGGHAALVTLLLEYPYPESVLNTYTDARGQWQYRAAFDINARDVSSQTALYIACTLGNLPVVDAILSYTVPCHQTPTQKSDSSSPTNDSPAQIRTPVTSPTRSGISLGIHAIVSKLTGGSRPPPSSEESVRRVHPSRTDVSRGADACVSAAVRGNHVAVLSRLLAAGADANASAAPPQLNTSEVRDGRRRSRSACPIRGASPSPATDLYHEEREGTWTALALACRLKHVQAAEILLSHGALDPTHIAARAAARGASHDLLAKILATKAYPDPDNKLNKSSVSEHVFNRRGADSALTYSSLCPSTPVMVNWRDLYIHATGIRMSWLKLASLHVNTRLSSTSGALAALTRVDLANNELRVLPAQLFTLLSIRYINAAQNKLERLPSPGDPFEEDLEGGRRGKKRPVRTCYTAPVLQELYLQDNRLDELPPSLFSLPALTTLDVSNNKLRTLPPQMWSAPALRDLNAALNHLRDLPGGEQMEPECSPASSPMSDVSASPSNGFLFHSQAKPSRSPSLEKSESEALDDENSVPVVINRAGNAVWSEARRVHTWKGVVETSPPPPRGASPLQSLNLSHNQFSCVPCVLACRATSLTRLNMAYNCLRSMSYVTSYPTSLRQLDLSHNEITCWPSLPQLENLGSGGDPLACFCPRGGARPRPRSGGSVRSQLLNSACAAKRHLRLDGLRTLILANNLLTRIQLTTDDDGSQSPAPHDGANDDDEDWACGSSFKGKLLFPLLSMLDVSCNMLRNIPAAIHELNNLSVLNISGNKDITDLPPQMGLLSRLWSLNASGCNLTEPIRSMISGGKYKSVDIVGYLKSVLHAATRYTRMKLMLVGLQGIGKTTLLDCLRQESAIQHRRKPTDHWAKRMGNKSSRRNMSTVGVDIGTWTYEKHRSTRGPVTFRTWDFGGQQEYYATHQYFLSRRSLYLVLWKVTDGKKGLAAALDWLRSIQARAPGSPVIMVATHYDQVSNCNLPECESPDSLQRLIRSRIMAAPDADKLGLPRVLDSIEVSCSTRHNIKLLADIIYSVAFSVKPPGSKEPLLEQRIPATYLALEECVTSLASDLQEPVLRHNEYKKLVTQYMQQKNHKMFRDAAELHQATMFLHENGVLLHYDDATLKELYFLRPQWLCDMLAHVVTVREINPFANNGIMKVEDLAHVFKASPQLVRGEDASSLGVSLLNKFELALCWDARVLLVPPLLPATEPAAPQLSIRGRNWTGTPRRAWPSSTPQLTPYTNVPDSRRTDSPTLITEEVPSITLEGRRGRPLQRLLLLTYIPCGFWARLCARLLADPGLARAPHALYTADHEMETDDSITRALELNWGWKLWRRGMKLVCGALTLVTLRELPPRHDALLASSSDDERVGTVSKLVVVSEGSRCTLDVDASPCIEIVLDAQVCVARRADGLPIAGYQSISLEPNPEVLAKVLALVSDHVDLLLEDWYPSLGTRFVHTSEGRCLITRVVPCPACLRDDTRIHVDLAQQAFRRLELGPERDLPPRLSQESRTSDGDSGVGAESNASSRLGSVEGIVNESGQIAYAWTVEQCILSACTNRPLHCAYHNDVSLRDVAPDTLLLDVEESKRARWEHITRSAIAGRGAFGTVLTAVWRAPGTEPVDVALKALQPVPPPASSDVQAQHAYKAAWSRWEREPAAAACRAYCSLRQELSILVTLRHPHVLPLRAVCAAPLALLLALAPMGALDVMIREYRGCGARVPPRVARALLLQVARALEYLHDRRIVYRDLKSENVLVWKMPRACDAAAAERADVLDVHVKLGDYGISRLAPPSGTKGFGGTEGFMAPEIMRYNGEEEYNEKVDCFSFGMLVYEVITGRQPFEGHEAVKEAILEGARPSLSPRDVEYPCCMIETMRRCWSGAPELRPSASGLVSVLSAPEYTALRDAAHCRVPLVADHSPTAAPDDGGKGWEIWYGGGEPERVHTLLSSQAHFTHHHTIRIPPDKATAVIVTAICRVGKSMWVGDSAGKLTVYSASTCAILWSISVQSVVGGAPSAIAAMQPLEDIQRVALALACGRLFLVTSQRPEPEGIFVLTELGTATELCCLAAVPTDDGYEVWSGGDALCAYAVSESGAHAADSVPAPGPVSCLVAGAAAVTGLSQPGECIYQWDVRTKQQTAKLDCSKLVPCSESLQSIAIDDELTMDRCKVTALCQAGDCIYAGTMWGCIIVADAATLRPLTVFRPYEADVKVIVPLFPHKDSDEVMLATFGSGYRPLLQRYAPIQTNANNQYSGYYCLLWKAQHWLPD